MGALLVLSADEG